MEEEYSELEQHEGYMSYNGLNKPPLVGGVPIVIFVALMASLVFICVPILLNFSRIVGVIIGLIILALYMLLREACSNDSNAIPRVLSVCKGFIRYKFKRVLAVRGGK